MPIKLEYNITEKNFCIGVKHDNSKELGVIEFLFFKIMSEIFLNKPIVLITRQPQKYSFGKGLPKESIFKIGKENIQVNKIENCDKRLLESISKEEEFKRGLLIVAHDPKDLFQQELEMILDNASNEKYTPISLKTVVCKDDGNTICLYNSDFNVQSMNELVIIVKNTEGGELFV